MIIDATKFFAAYRPEFGPLNPQQVDGLNFLITSFNNEPQWHLDLRWIAYALATIKHETDHTFLPIAERGGKLYLSKYYLNPALRRNLGNIKLSDAWDYKGRGYVQLTGRANYTKFAKLLGANLVEDPDLAQQPTVAFQIMTAGMLRGLFTGVGLPKYIQPNSNTANYYQARKVINRLDRAELIAAYAVKFELILRYATGMVVASSGF